MKFLKGLLYFILIVVVVAALAAAFAPGDKVVERSITIDAPAEKVYTQVGNFENWVYWDPWYGRDTNQVRTMKGEMGEPGYGYTWTSDVENVGSGTMEVTSYEGNEVINYHLVFKMGDDEMENTGFFKMEPEGESTKVTWSFTSSLSFPMKILNYMMDGWIGPDFEKGLAQLKDRVENSTDEELGIAPKSDVKIVSEHGINYAVLRKNMAMNDLAAWFGPAYGEIYKYCSENGMEPMGTASALYYDWNEETMMTDVAAAVPISEATMPMETDEVTTEAGKAKLSNNRISKVHIGGYFASAKVHDAFDKWLKDNEKTMTGPVVEEYIKTAQEVPDSNEYETRIIYYFE